MDDKKIKPISIKTLAGEFQTKQDLAEYNNSLFIANKKYTEKISQLEGEVKHLQMLLASTTPLITNSSDGSVQIVEALNEREIVESQIEIIKRRSMGKELSFEDTKKFEILVKTKKVIDEKDANKTLKTSSRPVEYSDAALINLASQPMEDGNGKQ